jgi:hypothetical protein
LEFSGERVDDAPIGQETSLFRARLHMEMPTVDNDSNNICHVIACKSEIKSVAVAEFY